MTEEDMERSIEKYRQEIKRVKSQDAYKKIMKAISIMWKEKTHTMLENAFKAYSKATEESDKNNAKAAFSLAIEKMIGGYGSVARTITINKEEFLNTILDNYPNIKKGIIGLKNDDEFNIFQLHEKLNLEKDPLSYITKICHIVNPKKCPLIWDIQIRDAFNLRDSANGKTDYKEYIKTACKLVNKYKSEDVYSLESTIWAGITTDDEVNAFKHNILQTPSSNPR